MEDTHSMTKEEALHTFFSQFGTVYQEDSVPAGEHAPAFPFGTYELATDSFNNEVPVSFNWWTRSSSWSTANAKAREIAETIGRGGAVLRCDGGAVWIKRGTPFARSMGDESDSMIKRKILNLTLEFLTED
jgi:hypothetical protein